MTLSLANIIKIIAKGLETFRRFPLALLSSVLATGIAIYFIEVEPRDLKEFNLPLAKVAMSAMLGVFVFTALRLLEHSISKRIHWLMLGLSIIGLIGLIGYYFSLPDESNDLNTLLYVFRHIFLIILFFVSILWTPFVKSSLPNVDYWEYAKGILFSLVMTVLFSIVFVIGVNVALFAVEELFDLDIGGKYYFIIDVFIIGIFSVIYFLSQIPSEPLVSKASIKPPQVEKFFTQYILTPLTGIYFVILYAYTAKVLVTMDWPKGILAWLIVVFSTVAVLTYLFWTHFATDQKGRWRKWIWLAVFVQTLMLFAAIGMRILDYSWTENRYMVLMLGVWLAGISVYFLLYKEAKIKWIFISLSVLIAISQVGPLSAYAVSKNAQTARLLVALDTYKQEKSEGNAIPIKERYEISDITLYLYDRYGVDIFEPLFPSITVEFKKLDAEKRALEKALREKMKTDKAGIVSKKEDYKKIQSIFKDRPNYFPHFLTHALGFKFVNTWEYDNQRHGADKNVYFNVQYTHGEGMRAQDIRGYDYMTHYYGDASEDAKVESRNPLWYLKNIDVTITFEKNILTILKNDKLLSVDMKAFINTLVKKHGTNAVNLEPKELTLEKENDTLKVRIEFQQINRNHYNKHENINFNSNILFQMKGE